MMDVQLSGGCCLTIQAGELQSCAPPNSCTYSTYSCKESSFPTPRPPHLALEALHLKENNPARGGIRDGEPNYNYTSIMPCQQGHEISFGVWNLEFEV